MFICVVCTYDCVGRSPATKSKWALRMTCQEFWLSVMWVLKMEPIFSLGTKHLCPLSHLSSPILFYFQSAYTATDSLMAFLYLCAFGWCPPSRFPSPHLPAFHSLLSSHGSILPSTFHVTHLLLSPSCRSPKTSSSLLHTALSSFQVSIHLLPHTGRLEAKILR